MPGTCFSTFYTSVVSFNLSRPVIMKSRLYLTVSKLVHLFPDVSHERYWLSSPERDWFSSVFLVFIVSTHIEKEGARGGKGPGARPTYLVPCKCFTSTVSLMSLYIWILSLQSVKEKLRQCLVTGLERGKQNLGADKGLSNLNTTDT